MYFPPSKPVRRPGALGQLATPVTPRAPRAQVTLAEIPDGFEGTKATLRVMRQFVRDAVRSTDQTIRQKALELFNLAGLGPREYFGEINTLHGFVRDQIRYVRDPVDVELVQTPEQTLEIGQGDCDDKSTLLAALLMASGHPAQFCAIGLSGEPISHVLVETRANRGWMPLETILPKPAGWFPDDVTSAYRLKI